MIDSESQEKPSSAVKSKNEPQPQEFQTQDPKVENVGSEEEDERTGIIPEGMDFRKFIGCGG
jgi:hypothetical protein